MRFPQILLRGLLISLVGTFLFANVAQATGNAQSPAWCCAFVVKTSIPFAWLRSSPSSRAFPLITLFPGALVTAETSRSTSALVWDGVQWWGKVHTSLFSFLIDGWVEVSSLSPVPIRGGNVGPVAKWAAQSALRVRGNIAYAWLRVFPASYARPNVTTVSGEGLTALGTPVADGRQWWWPVQDVQSGNWGWVEQASMEAAGGDVTPTLPPPPQSTVAPVTPQPGALNQQLVQAAFQPFENGFMVWLSNSGTVYVMTKDGRADFYPQSAYEGLADNPVTDAPPAGRTKPISGFGRVWGHYANVRTALGWALGDEQGYVATMRSPVGQTGYFQVTLPNSREVRVTIKTGSATWSFVN